MIYTAGHYKNYMAAFERFGSDMIFKTGRKPVGHEAEPLGYDGGCAFLTIDDAKQYIVESNEYGNWAVFGMNADWETETAPSELDKWRHVLIDAFIEIIPETEHYRDGLNDLEVEQNFKISSEESWILDAF